VDVKSLYLISAAAVAAATAAPATAAPIYVAKNSDLTAGSSSFIFQGVTFTFGSTPSGITVQNTSNGAVQAFGGFLGIALRPSSSFTNRGTVSYGPTGTQYASFTSPTLDPTALDAGSSFIGLRVTSGSDVYLGFANLTGSVLTGYGYETSANTAITATTLFPASAVPEAATWAMMIVGLGVVGGSLRRRQKVSTSVSFA
jgi:hypothetical protein